MRRNQSAGDVAPLATWCSMSCETRTVRPGNAGGGRTRAGGGGAASPLAPGSLAASAPSLSLRR